MVRESRSSRAKDLVARYMLQAGEGAPSPEVPDSRTAAMYRTSLRSRRMAGRWFDSEVEPLSEGRREVVPKQFLHAVLGKTPQHTAQSSAVARAASKRAERASSCERTSATCSTSWEAMDTTSA